MIGVLHTSQKLEFINAFLAYTALWALVVFAPYIWRTRRLTRRPVLAMAVFTLMLGQLLFRGWTAFVRHAANHEWNVSAYLEHLPFWVIAACIIGFAQLWIGNIIARTVFEFRMNVWLAYVLPIGISLILATVELYLP